MLREFRIMFAIFLSCLRASGGAARVFPNNLPYTPPTGPAGAHTPIVSPSPGSSHIAAGGKRQWRLAEALEGAHWPQSSVPARARSLHGSGAAAYGQRAAKEAQGNLPHPNGARRLQQPTEAESEEAAVDGCGRTQALDGVASSAAGEGPDGIATVETTEVPSYAAPPKIYTLLAASHVCICFPLLISLRLIARGRFAAHI